MRNWFAVTLVTLAACSANSPDKAPSNDIAGGDVFCISAAELHSIEAAHSRSESDEWRLVNHYGMCDIDDAKSEAALNRLARHGNERAKAILERRHSREEAHPQEGK